MTLSSTTESASDPQQVVSVINRRIYGMIIAQQPEETLNMLKEKAGKLGSKEVTGVRLVPMVDERGIRVMMAYGTVVTGGTSMNPPPDYCHDEDHGTPEESLDEFFAGICVALQAVTAMDYETLWGELVRSVGQDKLIQYAGVTAPDEWELAGFKKYALRLLGRKRPKSRPEEYLDGDGND